MKVLNLILFSMTMPNLHIDVCLIVIQTTPKFFNNLVGYIINKATASVVRSMQLSTWKNLSAQVCCRSLFHINVSHTNTWQTNLMLKVGICWAGVTCHNRSTPKHMRPINKPFIAMAGILHFGARLAFCTIRSTSTEMLLTHTPAPYA